jgi:hypothetical protein
VPAQPPLHIVTDRQGRQIDVSPLIKQLYRIDAYGDWRDPAEKAELSEIAGRLIAATGSTDAPADLLERMGRRISKPFREYLKMSWEKVAEACD